MFYKLRNWFRKWRLSRLFKRKSKLDLKTADFSRFAFPLIRQVYPRLIAANLVQVQPMPMPSGGIFWQNIVRPERQLAGFCNIISDYEFLKVDNDAINDPHFEPIFAYVYDDDDTVYLISFENEGHPIVFAAEEAGGNKIIQATGNVPDDKAKALIEQFRILI